MLVAVAAVGFLGVTFAVVGVVDDVSAAAAVAVAVAVAGRVLVAVAFVVAAADVVVDGVVSVVPASAAGFCFVLLDDSATSLTAGATAAAVALVVTARTADAVEGRSRQRG